MLRGVFSYIYDWRLSILTVDLVLWSHLEWRRHLVLFLGFHDEFISNEDNESIDLLPLGRLYIPCRKQSILFLWGLVLSTKIPVVSIL